MQAYRDAHRNGMLASAHGPPVFRLKGIPQLLYLGNYKHPNTGGDLQPPIEFLTIDLYGCGCEPPGKGIRLVDAHRGDTNRLVGGGERLSLGDGAKVSIRIRVVDYDDHGEQISSRRATIEQEGKTLAEIVEKVAGIVKRSIDKPTDSHKWVINGDTVKFEDLILLELRHVTSGSWQPVLAYADPTFH
ncbi:hypothetical protein EIP86_009672 [Pleurotus ostreatoroseus]|nr:hypothetical protein EIP86_009672 [Pleurotus ostreatoroseus]